jgi:hypothetical protein
LKIGKGSLGGKASGLAFICSLLQRQPEIYERFSGASRLHVPRTLVITTDVFDAFSSRPTIFKRLAKSDLPDRRHPAAAFSDAVFPAAVLPMI